MGPVTFIVGSEVARARNFGDGRRSTMKTDTPGTGLRMRGRTSFAKNSMESSFAIQSVEPVNTMTLG
jgi:hypothetical protein